MIKDIDSVKDYLEKSIKDFTDTAIIGISGGIDSSLVASICVSALGKENVYLVSMPYGKIDNETFNARSSRFAEQLGANHQTFSIKETTDSFTKELQSLFPNTDLNILTHANIRPRVRMNVLYSICAEIGFREKKRARVIGTGHLSEDIIGYDTKGGDALADIFILSDLVKSEVYQLANAYKVPEEIINATPSAGLYEGQTDKDELGYDYSELEEASLALFSLIKDGLKPDQISAENKVFTNINNEYVSFVVGRYKIHFHKHQAPLTVNLRDFDWFN